MKVLSSEIVGTICGNGYPDKLTHQDAMEGLFPVVRKNVVHRKWSAGSVETEQTGRGTELHARSASNTRGGDEMETVVRRLTPLECERLQGFPDGWTDIGEWTDSKGKVHKEADSPRYKALGNSIALPFWQYLARRICAQYERDITLGSLFDGIGGFPYVFERCGAKAVWASEIEEFPIAVTKKHFPEEENEKEYRRE